MNTARNAMAGAIGLVVVVAIVLVGARPTAVDPRLPLVQRTHFSHSTVGGSDDLDKPPPTSAP